MKNLARPVGVALVCVLAITGLAACGAEKLKGPDVAKDVQLQALTPRGIQNARVTCPKETEAKKDGSIKCSVSAEGQRGTVTATVLDEDGKLGKFQTDTDKIQMAVIEKNVENDETGVSKVKCPDSTKPKKGATFFCTGDIKGSGFGVVVVKQTDEASSVDVQLQRRKLTTAQIERNISRAVRKQGINADVTCPSKVESRKGSTFTCTVRNPANGKQLSIVATQTDDSGNFRLRVK